jgi:hypothetical protein
MEKLTNKGYKKSSLVYRRGYHQGHFDLGTPEYHSYSEGVTSVSHYIVFCQVIYLQVVIHYSNPSICYEFLGLNPKKNHSIWKTTIYLNS